MKIALTGSSGFVGSHIQNTFKDCVSIERNDTQEEILQKLQGVDVVINLAGAPIIKRWSDPYKKTLITSRIDTTRRIVNAINKSDVKHFISTSAIGAYPSDIACNESYTEHADDFLGELTKMWEDEAFKCEKPTAIIRFGVVLGKEGGALAQMLTPFSLGVGGIIGDGKMMTSWIDIGDLMRIYKFVIDKKLTGIYNAVSNEPVSNYKLTKTLGAVLKRPTILPIPVFALKIMYGEAASVLTDSKKVYPKALLDAGFTFKYPDIESSLNHILK